METILCNFELRAWGTIIALVVYVLALSMLLREYRILRRSHEAWIVKLVPKFESTARSLQVLAFGTKIVKDNAEGIAKNVEAIDELALYLAEQVDALNEYVAWLEGTEGEEEEVETEEEEPTTEGEYLLRPDYTDTEGK